MLGNDVLVFPDYGEAFLRSVKINALYAKRLTSTVLVLTEEEEAIASGALASSGPATLASNEPVPEPLAEPKHTRNSP